MQYTDEGIGLESTYTLRVWEAVPNYSSEVGLDQIVTTP